MSLPLTTTQITQQGKGVGGPRLPACRFDITEARLASTSTSHDAFVAARIGYRPGSVSRSMVKGRLAERFPAAGQVVVFRPYVKKIMHNGENRISFNLFNE